jgi:hypothetical protein
MRPSDAIQALRQLDPADAAYDLVHHHQPRDRLHLLHHRAEPAAGDADVDDVLSAGILLSGFMFPFAGMAVWAQYLGEGLPLTHYVRIVRAIMLKGATLQNLQTDAIALAALMLVAMIIAVTRFRRTLD